MQTAPRSHGIDPRLLDHLPTIPGNAVEFLRLCDDPSAGVKDIAAVASRDPGLLARILQVANSPFYAPREKVTDVSRAAAILGVRSLKMIGVGFAILGELWGASDRSSQLSGIIGASTLAGSGARSFSARLGTGRDEEALTSGLLSYLGELALVKIYPDEFRELWEDVGGLPSVELQRRELGTDGAEVGHALLERWAIPPDLSEGVLARAIPLEDRLRRQPNVYDAALGFGTAMGDLLAGHDGDALEILRPHARDWGLTEKELLNFWSDFRLAVRHTDQQMGMDVGRQLDKVITSAREDYLASPIHQQDQLDAAQRQIAELQAENERLEGLSLLDPLTEIANRAAFEQQLRGAIAAFARHPDERAVGVAMFDLDHFKQVNDREGHGAGDELLRRVANAGHRHARTDELFARLGGDEFALVMRAGSLDEVELATNRIRSAMVEAVQSLREAAGATVSAGAALMDRTEVESDSAAEQVVRAADDALYAAKRRGRNQTAVTPTMATGLIAGS